MTNRRIIDLLDIRYFLFSMNAVMTVNAIVVGERYKNTRGDRSP